MRTSGLLYKSCPAFGHKPNIIEILFEVTASSLPEVT